MWQFALLEVYNLESDEWPDGTPAEWIDEEEVLYCNGCLPDFITTIPLRKLLWWKVLGWLGVV